MTPTDSGSRSILVLRALALVTALGILLPSGALLAQTQSPQGRMIEEIRILGNERLESDTIAFYLASRAGIRFDADTAQLDYMSLFNTGWFRDLLMRWEEGSEGGIVLVVEVEEFPLLRQVRIEGTGKVKPDDFLERLELVQLPIEIDEPVDEQRLRDNIEVLSLMLQGDAGLQFVQVDLEIVDSELGAGVDAVYNVIEGDSVRISLVNFEGNTLFSDQELRWAMKRTREHHFLSFMGKSDRFSMVGYETDMFDLRNLYWRHGYLDFNHSEPRIEVFTEDRSLWFDDVQRLAVTIPIYEGVQYRIGEIRVEGNTRFSDEELLEAVGVRPGGVFDVDEVRAAQNAIQEKYANAGFLQVVATPFPDPDPDAAVADLIYRVEENGVYRVNRIEFGGNTHTRDFVLRRNVNLEELGQWSQSRFQTSVERLWRLGYFQNVEESLDAVPPGAPLEDSGIADPDYGQVNVNLDVEEVGRNQITFGGGVSALEGAFVQFGYTTRNLLGYGQTLSINGQLGKLRQNVRLSFADPYFLGKRLRFGADIFRDKIDFPDFQREGTGGAVRFGVPLNFNETLAAFLEYNYEVIDIGNIATTFGGISTPLFQALFLTEGRRTTSSLRPFLFLQSVDNPFLPTRGTRTNLSFEYAGGPFGGTLDFWRASVRTSWWIPTVTTGSGFIKQPRQIVAFNVRADWAQPQGELTELPIFERFFLGGSNSVRGTRQQSIGPIDERGNILGGTKALQYNLEYIFQLSPSLRVKAFHDAGQAWLETDSVKFSDMRRTAGFEFEVFAPVFNVPFRFFWAYNFDPLEQFGEQRSTFEFAIGSTF